MSSQASSGRVISMDQFRGYTVVGMILVNFVGGFAAVHHVFKHNNTYFSYADTIMPSFYFAVGYSFRLTMLKRLKQLDHTQAYLSYVWRSLALVFLSVMCFGIGSDFNKWEKFAEKPQSLMTAEEKAARDAQRKEAEENQKAEQVKKWGQEIDKWNKEQEKKGEKAEPAPEKTPEEKRKELITDYENRRKGRADGRENSEKEREKIGATWKEPEFRETFWEQWRVWLAKQLKSSLWETFGIIGVTQLVILPFVVRSFGFRLAATFAFAIGHAILCYVFNWGFVMGYEDNWMVKLWGTGTSRSWDGGFFGPICWAVPMLAGTLAYDLTVDPVRRGHAVRSLMSSGLVLMFVAYLLCCPSRLYDVRLDQDWLPEQHPVDRDRALHPFFPGWESLKDRSLTSLLSEPPFVAPPPPEERLENYWTMNKRIPTLSFIVCSTGFALALYGLFVWLSDLKGLQLKMFHTFGVNPLAAYFLHEMIAHQMHNLMPRDAPLWYCSIGFVLFYLSTYACVRYMERKNLFIRL